VTWLIRLYPPAWRRRYGRELAELMATQPASYGMAIDLIAGAIDAWLKPQSSTAAPAAKAKGAGTMVPRMLQLRCAGHGAKVTPADNVKAAAVTIGGTLALMVPLVWAIARYGRDPYLESLMMISWLVPTALSQHYTSLKGRRGMVQALLIGGQVVVVIAIALGAAWFGASIHRPHHS
jgi:hypothetical protein